MSTRTNLIVTDELVEIKSLPMTKDCAADICAILAQARQSVVRHVNSTMVLAYWLIGRRLVVEEQKGSRARYGEYLLQRISRELNSNFGKGFAEPQLRNCRLFYKTYPSEDAIRYALCIKLSWSHHRAIMRVGDPKARAFYLKEAEERNLSVREIMREIESRAYERVRANQDLDSVIEPGNNSEITTDQYFRDPVVAEFLGLQEGLRGKEKKLEKRILVNIEEFLLELGRGFSLVGRQVRIPTETSDKFVDFVFYNYILRCFVLVDLKTSKLTSRDIGQMDTYRRMYDALRRQKDDNPTIGILLGTEIDETDVKYSVMAECEQMFATKLLPYMPTKAELQFEIERARERTALRKSRTNKKRKLLKGTKK